MVDQSTVDSDMKPSSAILTSTFTTDRPSTAMTNVIASSAILTPTPTTDRPSTTVTNVIPTAGAFGGGSSAGGTIGGAVGGVIVAVLLTVVLVVLVAVIILRRRRNSKQGEQAIDNAVYEGNRCLPKPHFKLLLNKYLLWHRSFSIGGGGLQFIRTEKSISNAKLTLNLLVKTNETFRATPTKYCSGPLFLLH